MAGDFARLFASAVKRSAVGGYEPPFLPLGAITSVIDTERPAPAGRRSPQSVLFGKTDELPFYPNRRYSPQLRGLDMLTQLRVEQRELRARGPARTLPARARGVDVPAEAGVAVRRAVTRRCAISPGG